MDKNEMFEKLNLKSGELPLYYKYFIRDKMKHGDILVFGDDTYIKGLKNSMYGSDDSENQTYCEDCYICVPDSGAYIKLYNPLKREYVDFMSDKNSYNDRNISREIQMYLSEVIDYVKIDYKEHSGCYKLDINNLIKTMSPELCLRHDEDYHSIGMYNSGNKVKCEFIRDYKDQIDYYISNKDTRNYYILFTTPQQVYSFYNELTEFVENSNLGNKFSDIYDKVVNGEMTKDEFLKEISL